MASDEIVWQVINQQFCSYKLKTTKGNNFCRNEYNVTGLCSRQSCPLANSRYATIRAHPETGVIYLYMKTIERAHMPSKLWERVKLSQSYSKALEQIDQQLMYWPEFLKHKCKQRLTRLKQVAIRMRRLIQEEERLGEKLVPKLASKVRQRELGRERKAATAAKVERAIERELMIRLKSGAYGDKPLNTSELIWKKLLRGLEKEGEGVRDEDLDDGELEEDENDLGQVEYVSDVEGEDEDYDLEELQEWLGEAGSSDEGSEASDDDDNDDNEDDDDNTGRKPEGNKRKLSRPSQKPSKKRSSKQDKPRVQIGYDYEQEFGTENERAEAALAT